MVTDLYQTLGVSKTASREEIQRAYRKAAQKAHPDKGGSAEAIQEVNFAWSILGTQSKRLRYDSTGASEEVPDIEEAARQQLAMLVLRAVETGGDALAAVKAQINAGSQQLNNQQTQTEAALRNLKDQLKRWKYKGKRIDMIGAALEGAIQQKKAILEQIQQSRELGKTMLKLLEDYDYEKPHGQAPTISNSYFIWTPS